MKNQLFLKTRILIHLHESVIAVEHNDVQQLNPKREVLQFSEYAAVDN
jgi:hypothetical protein